MTGPNYAAALVKRAENAGVQIHVNTTVARIFDGGKLLVSTGEGCMEIIAKRVILSTGVRETPRAPRLISGGRPLGIFTTGTLQSMVYLKDTVPFRRPVIVGTELVSFSALLTCRHAGIKPVAMIEANRRITARTFCRSLPALLGVPLRLNTRLTEIIGKGRVTGVRVTDKADSERIIDCDGVLFTGQFTPESALLRMGNLDVNQASGGPVVDQYGRCSDPAYFATGNLLRPVETAGWCWNEGKKTATTVMRCLAGRLPSGERRVGIVSGSPVVKFTVPQEISLPSLGNDPLNIQLRFSNAAKGRLSAQCDGKTIWAKNLTVLPERRVLVPLPTQNVKGSIEIFFEERD